MIHLFIYPADYESGALKVINISEYCTPRKIQFIRYLIQGLICVSGKKLHNA